MTAGCLAVWLRLWHPWHTSRTSLSGADITGLSHFVIISVNNQFIYFSWPQQPWPLAWSNQYTTNHTECEMLIGKNIKLSMQHCGSKCSMKSEKWNLIPGALNGSLRMKGWQIKSAYCFLSCHHIFAVSLVLCICTLQTKPLVIHKPDEESRKKISFASSPLHSYQL